MVVKVCSGYSVRNWVVLEWGGCRSRVSSLLSLIRMRCSRSSMFLEVSGLERKLREVSSCPHSTWLLRRKSSFSDLRCRKEGSLRKLILFRSFGYMMLYSKSRDRLLAGGRSRSCRGASSSFLLISCFAAYSSHLRTSWFFCVSSWMSMYSSCSSL